MAKGTHILVAVVQFVLHALGIISILGGIVAFVFGNSERGTELLIGGVCWLILKYVTGALYFFGLKLSNNRSNANQESGKE